MSKVNLLDFNLNRMTEFFAAIDEKPFRAKQVIKWLHKGVIDFSLMTDINKDLQIKLQELVEIKLPKITFDQIATDQTRKWLLQLEDGNAIEMVFIPEKDRGTLCISSQVGCVLNCSFCSTGKQGFNRNLTVAEIIGQLWLATNLLDKKITNVVLMGMGEPLLNYDAVVTAIDIMLDDLAYNLSKYRVTLSTAGVIPGMEKLKTRSPVALAVSLHAPNDALRNILVPLNKKYPLATLMETCQKYFENEPRRAIMFEYVMLKGVNDQPEHAKQLIKLLAPLKNKKVNLIPFNVFPYAEYETSMSKDIATFQKLLMNSDVHTMVRKTRGDSFDGACGQLVGKVSDLTKRSQKWRERIFNPPS